MRIATGEARVAVVKRRFAELQPYVDDVYLRLQPHPAFTGLRFDHKVFHGKGSTTAVVLDELEDLDAEPLLVLSAAQANIVALSYFLALGLASGKHAPGFICLDDPIQSMDDLNVLGFADLCRIIRQERQLLVSTHDDRFSALLERKLAPRSTGQSTIVHRFVSWSRSGPSVETSRMDSPPSEVRRRVVRKAS